MEEVAITNFKAMLVAFKERQLSLKKLGIWIDRFNIYTVKEKPMSVYWSKQYVAQHPGFLESFNEHLLICNKALKAVEHK